MKHHVIIILSFLLLLSNAKQLNAQQISAHKGVVKDGYNFWVYTPADYDSNRANKPILLFLHGASLRGSNMELALRYGPIDALRRGCKIDAVIINPQCPSRGRWEPNKIMNVVEWVERHYAVDANRLYVIGMSLGAYGTLDFAGTYPDRVAAAIAMCGGSQQSEYCGLNELPLWIIHGTADRAVSVAQSERVVNAMQACGPTKRLIFTKLAGQNHGALARIFYLREPYDWLFEHRLTDSARCVNRNYTIQVDDMHNAYKGLSRQSIPVKDNLASKQSHPCGGSQSSDEEIVARLENDMDGGKEVIAESKTGKQSVKNKKEKSAKAKNAGYYTIKEGDNLGKIAIKHHTTVKKLCKLNGLQETSTLRVGRKIKVK
jgi:predicted peptidase